MALTVGEDTYISLADADTYWTNYAGGTNWASATDAEKEQALRQATQYVDKSYTWRGHHPGSSSQLLSWPRNMVVDGQGRTRTGIPQEVKDATAYLAEQALDGAILTAKERGGKIKNVKAGSVSVEFGDNAPGQRTFPYADLLLSDLTIGGKNSVRLRKA